MKNVFLLLFSFFYILINCFAEENIVKSTILAMSPEEKAAQVLMMGIEGKKTFPSYLSDYFGPYAPGAFILFGYNFSDTPQASASYIKSVKQSIQKLSKAEKFIPPFFASDFEGGRVYRIRKIASYLPAPKYVAENLSEDDALVLYTHTAEQIALLGIHLNLAPIVEKEEAMGIGFLGDRLFSHDKDIILKYSKIFIEGMKNGGVLSAVKHFPGNVNTDPHLSKSVIDVDEDTFYTEFVDLFKEIIYDSDGVVLISHVEVPFIEKTPFCFSKKGIENILRDKLKFRGLIITDDMAMKALKEGGRSTSDNVISAISAGCDMVMCSEPRFRELIAIISNKMKMDNSFEKRIDEAVFNILKIKMKMGLIDESCMPIEKNKFDEKKFYNAKEAVEKILKENTN